MPVAGSIGPHFAFASGRLGDVLELRPWGGPAVVPPSTGSTIPVICAARSLARNSDGVRHVRRRSHALQRLHEPHDLRLVVGRVDVGRDVGRRDAVHADAVFGEVDRDRTG